MLFHIDLPNLCTQDGQDRPVIRESRFAPIIVFACHLIADVTALVQLLVSCVHREENTVSVTWSSLLLRRVVDGGVLVILVRRKKLDVLFLETRQQRILSNDFPELIRLDESLDVVHMSKVLCISASQIASEVHIPKEELVVMSSRKWQPA